MKDKTIEDAIKELNKQTSDETFIHEYITGQEFLESCDLVDWEKEEIQNALLHPLSPILEMANFIGNRNKLEAGLPFSFYISSKEAVHGLHAIRAKILWNSSKTPSDPDGTLDLHGDYLYRSGSHKYKPTEKELSAARSFFKKYKCFFSAVWEGKLDPGYLQDYFSGELSLSRLLAQFEGITEEQFFSLNHCCSVEDVEACVRSHHIFSMND